MARFRTVLLALPLLAGCDFASYSPPPDLTFQAIPVDLAPAPADLAVAPDLATAPADLSKPKIDMEIGGLIDMATATDDAAPTDGGTSD